MVRERRIKSVFPAGFDSSPSDSNGSSSYQCHSTEQLFNVLVDQYSPFTGADLIRVKTTWYGKQTTSPRHEFILVQVEDGRETEEDGKPLVNYLVLDRNVLTTKRSKPGRTSQTSIKGGRATDRFRVAYDGKLKPFLNNCDLYPHRWLGKLEFSLEEPLHLYKLVALANVVSAQNPDYYPAGSHCYMFAGVIWDSLCKLYPSATLEEPLREERGKNGWYRYIVTESQVQVIYNLALEAISEAQLKIKEHSAELEAYVQSQIGSSLARGAVGVSK